jgi:GH24 family phage-related lysozyme (muramidase)
MAYASVRAAAQEAAKRGTLTPHQLAALTALDESLTDDQKRGFTELWRATGSPAGAPPPAWLTPALTIIKRWEGCKLTAYQDVAGVWTVGWGTTVIAGKPVQPGQTITQAEADALLEQGVRAKGAQVLGLLPMAAEWKPNQTAAIVSFTYNVGAGALEDSTLRKRLLAGDDPAKVVAEELPRWNRAGGGPVEGLTRRRADEVRLFNGAPPLELPAQQAAKFTPNSPFSFRVTPHITYGELALGQEARRFRHQYQCDLALELCQFLEKARAAFGGKPVIITSGFRPPEINRSVGGASASEHLYNAPGVGALDWYIDGANIKEVQEWALRAWPYSTGKGAPKGFVHTGIRQGRPRVVWDY